MKKLPSALALFSFLYTGAAVIAAKPDGDPHVYKTVGDRELSIYVTKPNDWKSGDRRPAIV